MEKSEGQNTIYDNEGLDDYYHLGNDTRDVKALCDLLNEQEKRIQELEKENGELKREVKRLKCINKQLEDRLDRDIALNMNCGDVE